MADQPAVLESLVEAVRTRVAARVAALAGDDPTAEDPLRGLYLTPEAADRLLAAPAPGARAAGGPVVRMPAETGHRRLDRLCADFGLDGFDRLLLLLALAPDLDRRFGPLYGYLNDDVGRRRATVGLALDLAGVSTLSGAARARLAQCAPLIEGRLVVLEQTDRPLLERELRVPDAVTSHLLVEEEGPEDVWAADQRGGGPASQGDAGRAPLAAGGAAELAADRRSGGSTQETEAGPHGESVRQPPASALNGGAASAGEAGGAPLAAGGAAELAADRRSGGSTQETEPGPWDGGAAPGGDAGPLRDADRRIGGADQDGGSTGDGEAERAPLAASRASELAVGRRADASADEGRAAAGASGEVELGVLLRVNPGRPVYLRVRGGVEEPGDVERVAGGLGRGVRVVHPGRTAEPAEAAVADALRDARLGGDVLVVGPLPAGGEEPWVRAVARPAVRGAAPVPAVLFGTAPFEPSWTPAHVLARTAEDDDGADRAELWRAALAEAGQRPPADLDLDAETAVHRMGPARIRRAARAAADLAAADGGTLLASHLHEAARLQNASGLERHARRVRPAVTLDDLVLPDEPRDRVRELVHRAAHRRKVLRGWGMRRGGGRGAGVVALFAGDSGTGKTMAAESVAGALGLDLYVVELAAVVDKYIGETEKNLDRIFNEADNVNAVLLFDEADAVFGRRSEVKDSHDRYANLESAYLLQRLESFDGVAVLTTNLRGNLDEAFTRRFDVAVDFPFPDARQRRALWESCLRPPLPCADDLDTAALAAEFELSGGGIRSAAVTAAYLAAAGGGTVGAAEAREGARREYAKAGRLVPGGALIG
ncbi:hypothetical protein BIV57_08905 [Mangrovactinospora gilvigrisea]|uniref:AAA+ ATPase domain-containing protein n=1 Tax=Mangrovactinospora gilvigrisea TaxID=1428644 RepID=A0A1J7BGU2_9ACTN|nr:ATP-binding protein [Mangrovactinospora gilvigrisea]OIV37870.1 hypothetical protein BIV57_08905 [Mangrovactinospora gilvigrisea]